MFRHHFWQNSSSRWSHSIICSTMYAVAPATIGLKFVHLWLILACVTISNHFKKCKPFGTNVNLLLNRPAISKEFFSMTINLIHERFDFSLNLLLLSSIVLLLPYFLLHCFLICFNDWKNLFPPNAWWVVFEFLNFFPCRF